MKLAAILLLAALTAQAETIPLESTACSVYRSCYNVAPASGMLVELNAMYTSTRVLVTIDGVVYYSAAGVSNPGTALQGIVATNEAGESLTLDATFEHHVTQVNSGRAHYQIQKWTLVAGQVVR